MNTVIVIGGGASGLVAAAAAAEAGAKAVLLEKNSACGKKLNITGKGRGNITNTADADAFVEAFGKNGRFLYSAFSVYFRDELLRDLKALGVDTVTERGGRIFPAAQKASVVTGALVRRCSAAGVRIRTGTKALSIDVSDGRVRGVGVFGGVMRCDAAVVATGGLSYPATGSTGDGYGFARAAGHTVTALRPSLCGIVCREKWPASVSGLTLKNVTCSLLDAGGKAIASETGELLFTHKGVSGPVILTLSGRVADSSGPLRLSIDLKPWLTRQELEEEFRREFTGKGRLRSWLDKHLPRSLAGLMPDLSGVSDRPLSSVTSADRRALADAVKGLTLTVASLCPMEEAIITRGGVVLGEINPGTMESKRVGGLYFCGEVLDIDARTGGYNLQAAFSTGYVAGVSAARLRQEGPAE
ncbi:MAG: aminoacetone oxidase family FAD-binding enzyme [Abditibacteriota bacterium]|nr:aminoacetone oxidase family FAD-binding enzyme [Abditibacteriota bacterium]